MFYILLACSKDEPKVPGVALLIFPLENSECTIGQTVNSNNRLINFQWEASAHTQSYQVRVVNLRTNISQTVTTNETQIQLPLTKGLPYSWSVTSANNQVPETATSEIWNFFNAGNQTTHAPFPTKILAPLSGATVIKDINNEVVLSWQGSDIDGDIDLYEVYFSTVNPPVTLLGTTVPTVRDFSVSVNAGTVYYWSIKTVDQAGNAASSGVYSFRAL